MADNMSIDKKEANRDSEDREDSMEINSPTPEAETGAPQENATTQKRKGGRKPVRHSVAVTYSSLTNTHHRYMLLLRNANNVTVKPKPRSENVAPSTLSS